jgi:hypothetical protein
MCSRMRGSSTRSSMRSLGTGDRGLVPAAMVAPPLRGYTSTTKGGDHDARIQRQGMGLVTVEARTAAVGGHVCKPPGVQAPGTVWTCADCRRIYQYRPVKVSELGGRIINLWVRRGWQLGVGS